MLPEIKELANRIFRDCEDDNALDAKDLAYLEQIKTTTDLLNFADDGSGKMVNLAADAAKALGQSDEWIARKIDGPYYNVGEPAQSKPTESPLDFSHSGLGISGLANYDEKPIIPSVAAIKRMEKIENEMQICRRCGASDLIDGAMFTTMAGSGYCDDCC